MVITMSWMSPVIALCYCGDWLIDFVLWPSPGILYHDLRGIIHKTPLRWLEQVYEFLCKYHMDCDTLDAVANLIQGDPVFKRGRGGQNNCPSSINWWSLCILLGEKENLMQTSAVCSMFARVIVNKLEIVFEGANKFERGIHSLAQCGWEETN